MTTTSLCREGCGRAAMTLPKELEEHRQRLVSEGQLSGGPLPCAWCAADAIGDALAHDDEEEEPYG